MASGFLLQYWLSTIFFWLAVLGQVLIQHSRAVCHTLREVKGAPAEGLASRNSAALLWNGKVPNRVELLATCKYYCMAANGACLSAEGKEFRRIRASVCLISRLFSTFTLC